MAFFLSPSWLGKLSWGEWVLSSLYATARGGCLKMGVAGVYVWRV